MTPEDITNRFTYHDLDEDEVSATDHIRSAGLMFATLINDVCPEGREKSLAVTKLEECVMWANASVARSE